MLRTIAYSDTAPFGTLARCAVQKAIATVGNNKVFYSTMPGHWSEEAKEAARQRIYRNKPWNKSTGAKTEEGKAM